MFVSHIEESSGSSNFEILKESVDSSRRVWLQYGGLRSGRVLFMPFFPPEFYPASAYRYCCLHSAA